MRIYNDKMGRTYIGKVRVARKKSLKISARIAGDVA
jgi:hypothetical protein